MRHRCQHSGVEGTHRGVSAPIDRATTHRAVDIWKINGKEIVDPANYALTEQVMRAGIAAGAYQAGGQVQLEPSSEYFTDDTHHDHIYLGFR